MQHKLTARCAAVGGDDRDLDAELVGRAGLALADALGLRGMEGIQLPAALALLLGADLGGSCQRQRKNHLEVLLTGNLAADVTDQPAKPAAQDPQLAAVAVELLGVGVSAGHHCRVFRPIAAPACRRAACANGSGRSVRAGTHAGRTLRR